MSVDGLPIVGFAHPIRTRRRLIRATASSTAIAPSRLLSSLPPNLNRNREARTQKCERLEGASFL